MTESTMIDRVARALHARRHGEWYEGPLKMTDSQRGCLADARAAIEAMREPTERMCSAPEESRTVGARRSYQAMIDAALNEHANAR
jgi:hypothetical protein